MGWSAWRRQQAKPPPLEQRTESMGRSQKEDAAQDLPSSVPTYSRLARLLLNCSACARAVAAFAWMKFHCKLQTGENGR